jgi:hypothetical protein
MALQFNTPYYQMEDLVVGPAMKSSTVSSL